MADPRIKVDWTDALRAEVVKAWESNDSAGVIAARIPGATRSGILGVIHREGKKRKDSGTPKRTRPKPEPKPAPAPKPAPPKDPPPSRLPATGWHNSGVPIAGHIPPEPPAPEPMRLTLMELHSRSCRWPVTDRAPWRYCGHRVAGENSVTTPYCAHHARAALPKEGARKPRSAKRLERDLRNHL